MSSKRPPNVVEETPSGIEIQFWDEVGLDGEPQQRRYRIDGERFTNVTTILGVLAKPALLDWAANLAREGQDWRDVRDEAGERGKSAHELVVRSMLDERTSLSELPPDARPYGQAAYSWLADHGDLVVVEAERMVAAPKHRLAGRFDLLCTLPEREAERTLVDFKTVSKWAYKKKDGEPTDELLPPYDENLLQLDLYTTCIEASGYPVPDEGLIVRLGPDGAYDETFVDLQPDRGLAIVRAYRCKAAATAELKAARKREAVAA